MLQAGDRTTIGLYQQLTTTFTLTPSAGNDGRSFDLGDSAIVEKVITYVIVVAVHPDWGAGRVDTAYELGIVELDASSIPSRRFMSP